MKRTIGRKSYITRLFTVLGAALIISGLLLSTFVQNAFADTAPKVTICHAAGLDGTTKYTTITIGYNAAYGPAGHFSEPGTPNAGHEDDYEGACEGEDVYVEICYGNETIEVKESDLEQYPGYSEGACESPDKVTICYDNETLEVDEADLENYDEYTFGACNIPDPVTICYNGVSMQVERSELGNYPGYNLGTCPSEETINICFRGLSMTVLVADLDNYPGYNLNKCPVGDDDPQDDPDVEIEVEEVEPLSVPQASSSGLLIPVTGGDLLGKIFGTKLGFSLLGFGLVLTGLGVTYKGFKKKQ